MNSSAAQLRTMMEAKLADRIPGAFSPQLCRLDRRHSSGEPAVDLLLNGGFPLGSVCELTGPEGSGRSSLALSVLAGASREAACAYIDVSDALSPQAAAAAGVYLPNLLWVRFSGGLPSAAGAAGVALPCSGQVRSALKETRRQGCGRLHPRGETRHLAPKLEQMLACSEERRLRKQEGTPGHPNQPLGLHTASYEQVSWERFNLRRVDTTDPLRQMDQAAAVSARERAAAAPARTVGSPREAKPWDRLDRALRATDQVLQSGGFRVVVLDLASVLPEQALRIPSASWWRFQKASQLGDAILLLLTRQPCARSCAACVLECTPAALPCLEGVLSGLKFSAGITRQRSGVALQKKAPGRATTWSAAPVWMRGAGRQR